METQSATVIDHLGGTSKVARLLSAPVSTVHSWRKNGIPASRMAHLQLVAEKEGIELPVAASCELIPTATANSGSTGKNSNLSGGEEAQ